MALPITYINIAEFADIASRQFKYIFDLPPHTTGKSIKFFKLPYLEKEVSVPPDLTAGFDSTTWILEGKYLTQSPYATDVTIYAIDVELNGGPTLRYPLGLVKSSTRTYVGKINSGTINYTDPFNPSQINPPPGFNLDLTFEFSRTLIGFVIYIAGIIDFWYSRTTYSNNETVVINNGVRDFTASDQVTIAVNKGCFIYYTFKFSATGLESTTVTFLNDTYYLPSNISFGNILNSTQNNFLGSTSNNTLNVSGNISRPLLTNIDNCNYPELPLIDINLISTRDNNYNQFLYTVIDNILYNFPDMVTELICPVKHIYKYTILRYPLIQDVLLGIPGATMADKLPMIMAEFNIPYTLLDFILLEGFYAGARYMLSALLYDNFNVDYLLQNYYCNFLRDLQHSRYSNFLVFFTEPQTLDLGGVPTVVEFSEFYQYFYCKVDDCDEPINDCDCPVECDEPINDCKFMGNITGCRLIIKPRYT